MPASTQHSHALVRKLDSIASLTDDEVQAIVDLPMQTADLGPDQDIVRDGDRPARCCLLLEGFACRYKITPRGTRQILSFHVPGDIPDLQSLHLRVMDHGLATVSACKVAFIDHEDARALMRAQPRLADLFWRNTLIDAAIFRTWMVGLGRCDASQQVAHLLRELHVKLLAVGLADEGSFPLPITQEELADALGLSPVHVNRTLQDLRRAGLIVTTKGWITVPDLAALAEAGEFDPLYLHLDPGEPLRAA
jgi:CRP-like cAMP-binding protein